MPILFFFGTVQTDSSIFFDWLRCVVADVQPYQLIDIQIQYYSSEVPLSTFHKIRMAPLLPNTNLYTYQENTKYTFTMDR